MALLFRYLIYIVAVVLSSQRKGGLSRRRAHLSCGEEAAISGAGGSDCTSVGTWPVLNLNQSTQHNFPDSFCSDPLLVETLLALCPGICSLGSVFCLKLCCVDLTGTVEGRIFGTSPGASMCTVIVLEEFMLSCFQAW